MFVDGEKAVTLKGERIAEEFQVLIEQYVKRRFGTGSSQAVQRERATEIRS